MTGTLCLTEYFKGIEEMFIDGVHLHWWKTLEELRLKINYCLDRPNEAYQVGLRGMIEVRENHTWTARVKEMIDFIHSPVISKEYAYLSTDTKDACIKMGAHVIDGKIPEPFDKHLDGQACSCGKIKYVWTECGCTLKEWQLMAQENI